jgi:hypothetical protein
VIEMDGPREAIDVLEALEDRDPVAGAAEQRRERLARRAIADDRHVDFEFLLLCSVESHAPHG